jgi:hypothetical protein
MLQRPNPWICHRNGVGRWRSRARHKVTSVTSPLRARRCWRWSFANLLGCLAIACSHGAIAQGSAGASAALGLPASDRAALPTPDLAAIGQMLFFDRRLSADGSTSCASCHVPELAFADGRGVGIGTSSRLGTRNTISLLNVSYQRSLFWDGRRDTLGARASSTTSGTSPCPSRRWCWAASQSPRC